MCSHDVPRPGGGASGTRVPDILDGVGVVVATRGVAVGDGDMPGPFPPEQIARPLSGLGVVTLHTATVWAAAPSWNTRTYTHDALTGYMVPFIVAAI